MFSKAPVVRKYHKAVEELFAILIILFAAIYLLFFGDVFGFVITSFVFLLLWKRPKEALLFFSMYILEVGGPAFGAWKWQSTGFYTFRFLPSN